VVVKQIVIAIVFHSILFLCVFVLEIVFGLLVVSLIQLQMVGPMTS
jgi:hypothetical protein